MSIGKSKEIVEALKEMSKKITFNDLKSCSIALFDTVASSLLVK